MATIIDGKELAKNIREELKLKVDSLKKQGIFPKLAVIMVGNDPGSTVYVRNKSKAKKPKVAAIIISSIVIELF